MASYFYKIGDHVLLSSKPAEVVMPLRPGSEGFAYLQFGDDTPPIIAIREGDNYGR